MSGNDHIIKRLILFNRSFLARAFQLKKESADGEIFFLLDAPLRASVSK